MARATRSPDARGQNFAKVTTPPILNCYVWATAWRKRGARGTKRCCSPVRVVMPPFVKSVMRPDLIMSTCFVLQLRDMTSHAARLKDQNIVATARGQTRDASHQNRSGNHARNRLRRGCSAIRPICCIRMSSREHAAEFATFAGHSAKMPRGDFSAKGRNRMTDQCRLARNLLERCSLFARGRQQAGVPCPIPC